MDSTSNDSGRMPPASNHNRKDATAIASFRQREPGGQVPGSSPPRGGVTVTAFKPVTSGALRGFCTVRLGIGLTIAEVGIFESHGKRWCALPSKPQVGRDGQVLTDANGKRLYTPLMNWSDRAQSDRFSEAVIDALLLAHPDAFPVGG